MAHPGGAVLLAQPLPQEEGCLDVSRLTPYHGETFGLVFDQEEARAVVEGAVRLWQGCSNQGGDFPRFLIGKPGIRPLYIRLQRHSSTDECGRFQGNEVVLFESAQTGSGRILSCGSLAMNLAHELGHALGLPDVPRSRRCRKGIMVKLEDGNLFSRAVTADECRAAGDRWTTLAEGAELPPPFPLPRRPTETRPLAAASPELDR